MWSELLLAMGGHHGELFSRKNGDGPLEVMAGVPYMHQSERQMLQKICSIGHLYANLEEFVSASYSNDGMYVRALRTGVDEQLTEYRELLLTIEDKVRAEVNLPLSHMYNAMEKWYLLLPALAKAVDEVRHGQCHGAPLLDLLHRHSTSGIRSVEKAFGAIAVPCRKVLTNQISVWVLHGLLLDRSDEFFIMTTPGSGEPAASESSALTATLMRSWGSFSINQELLPSSLSLRLADKVLFIGKATRVFGKDEHRVSRDHPYLEQAELDEFQRQLAIAHLGGERWDVAVLDTVIEHIRLRCAHHLWTVMTRVAQLGPLLFGFKDYMLAAKGEFFLEFYHQANAFCRLPITPSTVGDAQAAYLRAASLLGCDESGGFNQFQLVARPHTFGGPGEDTDTGEAWAEFGFQPNVPWPLQLIFTDEVVAKYNGLFAFLFRVNRVQYALGKAWAEQMQHQKTLRKGNSKMAVASRMMNLRANMSFLVDNIQQYLKGDVIDTQFELLMQSINHARDFDAIGAAHHNYITALLVQTFRTTPSVRRLLGDIFALCESLCDLVERGIWRDTSGFAELDRVETGFQRQTAFLFKMLTSASSKDHLSQLLLRINYNQYFSQIIGDV